MEGFFNKLLVSVTAQHGLKCLNDFQKKENVTSRKRKEKQQQKTPNPNKKKKKSHKKGSHYTEKIKIKEGEEGKKGKKTKRRGADRFARRGKG